MGQTFDDFSNDPDYVQNNKNSKNIASEHYEYCIQRIL